MFGLFKRVKSRERARDRLKLVLSYDRAQLAPGRMEELREELLEVIGRYFPAEKDDYTVEFEQKEDRMVFVANVPLQRAAAASEH
ncbi:MAG: cell division topological specificity factor MinE [Truepera sp.]|nr:cell division topological specificity factor MinE [Truepera sp.]MDE0100617.1 cell division topological specificity factor MinE [Truepera sp.]